MTGVRAIGLAALSAAALLAACAPDAGSPSGWLALGAGTPTAHGTATPRTPGGTASTTSAAPSRTPVVVASALPHPPSSAQIAVQALARIVRRLPSGAVSVAVRNESTGATFGYGERGGMWTASVYKLLVLEALLLERQKSGAWFSSEELADITAMIENSDNQAGWRMFGDAGGYTALATAVRKLGMPHTRVSPDDPTFTTMSARDGLQLLSCLVDRGPLRPRSRAFVLSLMSSVEADQRWGAGVLADPGTTFENKNGWLAVDDDNGPGEDDDSRWVVNSVGIVTVHAQQLLVSVFTRHNPDLDTGIRLVQRIARLAAQAVLPSA